ncbi:MAG TPA: divalent-cation tolerance protein CutA [Rhodanobacteraceae bacterium]
MPDALLVLTTCPDADTAARLAHALVDERLAACVNRLPGIISTYRWEGRVEEASEVQLLIKTTPARFDALATRIAALHPYAVPELVALDITVALPAYLTWLHQCVTPDR